MHITHINSNNNPNMVDISSKNVTEREAIASGKISMNKGAYSAVINDNSKKGPIINTAVIASIMGAKKTSDLIPMCHPIILSKIESNIHYDESTCSITLEVKVKCSGKTGVEMEALSGVSIGLLTIYDMLKSIDKGMTIQDIRLVKKQGGKSGLFTNVH